MNAQATIWMMVGLLLVSSAAAATINISSGEAYNFTYVNLTNETVVQGFFCAPNATTTFCAYNVTVPVNLIPGEIKTVTNGTCTVNAACSSTQSTDNRCSIDTTINNGDTYQNTGGACNIKLKCEEPDEEETSVTLERTVKLYTDGNSIVFEFEGDRQQFNKNGTFSHEFNARFSCPTTVRPEEFTGEDLDRLCQQVLPYQLQWTDTMLKNSIDKEDRFLACSERENNLNAVCEEKVQAVRSELATIQVQLTSAQNDYNTCLDEKAALESQRWFYIALDVAFGIWAGGATILCLILGIMHWRGKAGQEEE